ncbi:hypothetical protein LTR95_013976 [Oleoguttula sp. CCFEE 5521]
MFYAGPYHGQSPDSFLPHLPYLDAAEMPKKGVQKRKQAELLKTLTEDRDRLTTKCKALQTEKTILQGEETTLQTEKTRTKRMLHQTIAQRDRSLLLVQAFCCNVVYRGGEDKAIEEEGEGGVVVVAADADEALSRDDDCSDSSMTSRLSARERINVGGLVYWVVVILSLACACWYYDLDDGEILQSGMNMALEWFNSLRACNCGFLSGADTA